MGVDPQANAGYMIAAYIVTAVILGGYAVRLWLRSKRMASSEEGIGNRE